MAPPPPPAGSSRVRGKTGTSPNGSELRIELSDAAVDVKRRRDEIAVIPSAFAVRQQVKPVECAGGTPTTVNTDRVRVRSDRRGSAALRIYLAGAPFAPGATEEGDGSSEIEFSLNMPRFVDPLVLGGTRARDAIRLGVATEGPGVNLNAGETIPDVDLVARRPLHVSIGAGRGRDTLMASGGPEFALPYPTSVSLFGGPGGDLLVGGAEGDFLHGGGGGDRFRAGPGKDRIDAQDGRRERVACGPGRDLVAAAGHDRLRGCERVTSRRGLYYPTLLQRPKRVGG